MEKRRAVILAVFAVAVAVVAVLASYALVFERPIKASAERVILEEDDLPGWNKNYSDVDTIGDADTAWSAGCLYYNSSIEVGRSLSIFILSERSSAIAHETYQGVLNLDVRARSTLKLGDEAVVFTTYNSVVSQDDIWMDEFSIYYVFREANIYVSIKFTTIGDSLDPGASYRQEWMDQIVQLQADKVHQNNIHLLTLAGYE